MSFLIDVPKGTTHKRLLLRDVVAAIADYGEECEEALLKDEVISNEGRGCLLPSDVTGEDWANAICSIFDTGGSNFAYCYGMGDDVTEVEDFVRLGQPLKKKGCKTADLVPLFRHLWMNPDLEGANWTEEMTTLHDKQIHALH